jgi:glycosyltransferase involved in cell wall biosynthesis
LSTTKLATGAIASIVDRSATAGIGLFDVFSVIVISKDEPELDLTLRAISDQARAEDDEWEIVVVDASAGRLEEIRHRHPSVQWIDYRPPPGVTISIPHQRNRGVEASRGDTIVFVDAGCLPHTDWLRHLLGTIQGGEDVVAGLAVAPEGTHTHYQLEVERVRTGEYLHEAPTINLAFRRPAFDAVGGFDETFEYGSDIDFTWRLTDHGFRIRSAPEAVVEHDWGDPRRQLKRAYQYGCARARLYRKHVARRRRVWREDPVLVAYPLFLLGLPLTCVFPAYPLLLLVPAWRARRHGATSVIVDHLVYGAGVLAATVQR